MANWIRKRELIGKEDISSGVGTFSRTTSTGGTQTLTKFSVNEKTALAHDFTGANAGEKISNAIDALPATGGIVDARGLEGAQTIVSLQVTKANVEILLGAATYTVTSTLAYGIQLAANNCKLRGFAGTVIQQSRDWIDDDYSLVEISGVDNCEISGLDCRLTMVGAVGTAAANVHAIAAVSNGATPATGFKIINNRAWTKGTDLGLTWRMVGIFGGDVDSLARCTDGQICGNYLDGCLERNIYVFFTDDIVIANNTLTNVCADGISTQTGRGIRVVGSRNVTVVGNTIETNDVDALVYGIGIEGGSANSEIVVVGNTVRSASGYGGGLLLTNTSRAVVSGNVFSYVGTATNTLNGIILDSSAGTLPNDDILISGNFISDWYSNQIRVNDASGHTDISIVNNWLGKGHDGTANYFSSIAALLSSDIKYLWNTEEDNTTLINYGPANIEIANNADSGMAFYLTGGSTTTQNVGLFLREGNGNLTKWAVQKDNSNNFNITDSANSTIRLRMLAGDDTILDADGSGTVDFNVTSGSGTGGARFGDGAGASVATVNSAGVGTFTKVVIGTTNIYVGAQTTRDTVRTEVGTGGAIGSLYLSTAGKMYLKIANADATADWERVTTSAAD